MNTFFGNSFIKLKINYEMEDLSKIIQLMKFESYSKQ